MKRGFRFGGREAYLRPARKRRNFTMRTGCMTTRIRIEAGAAVGVEYLDNGRPRYAAAAREVICSAGAIQSPQLLELSGIGQASLLEKLGIPVVAHLSGVGENCRDHLMARVSYRCKLPITLNDKLNHPLRKVAMGLRYVAWGDGMLATSTATVHALARSDPRLARPDVKLQIHHLSSDDPRDPRKWVWDSYSGFGIGTFVLAPESTGAVHIQSRNALDAPRISANYLAHENDRRRLLAALRLARRIAAQPALSELIVEETRPGREAVSDDALLAHAGRVGQTSYHPIGTCRMGAGDDAVVDAKLRVRGVRRLRVADASVMPTMVSSNTNAASMMIGDRCAEFILEEPQ